MDNTTQASNSPKAKQAVGREASVPVHHAAGLGNADNFDAWHFDLMVTLLLVLMFFSLRPLLPDGDAISHADRALRPGLLDGMVPKHAIYAPILHLVHDTLAWLGWEQFTLEYFTLVSAISGAAIYFILVRIVFTPLLGERWLARLCSLGVVLSLGVLKASCTIETYALALLLDVALVAICLHKDVTTPKWGIAAGVVFVLAVGVHATGVLMVPFLVLTLLKSGRGRPWATFVWPAGTVLVGALVIVAGLVVACGEWPPGWENVLPIADPEPAINLAGRLARSLYGFARTIAWLMPFAELRVRPVFATVYLFVFGLFSLLTVWLLLHRASSTPRRTVYWAMAILGLLSERPKLSEELHEDRNLAGSLRAR